MITKLSLFEEGNVVLTFKKPAKAIHHINNNNKVENISHDCFNKHKK